MIQSASMIHCVCVVVAHCQIYICFCRQMSPAIIQRHPSESMIKKQSHMNYHVLESFLSSFISVAENPS